MCDPITIAGLVLSAGSVAANKIANDQVASARNDAMQAERMRQSNLDREAKSLNDQTQQKFGDFTKDKQASSQALGDYFKTNVPATADPGAPNTAAGATMPVTSNDVVTREIGNKAADARAYSDQQGAALGDLRSFGDVLGADIREQAKTAALVGQLGGFKQGSSNVLGYELEDANNAGGGLRTLGDVLGGASSIAGAAGASGKTLGDIFHGGAGALPKTVAAGTVIKPAAYAPSNLGALY